MKLLRFTSFILLALLSLGLVACGDNNEGKEESEITDDLERDENGNFNVDYLEGVEINLWSVIGAPDQTVLHDLITKFNTEFQGSISIKVTDVGHYDYYNALDNTYANDYSNFPDICLMHNEKNIEYALKDYFRPVDDMVQMVGFDLDFNNIYDNIERTTVHDGKHYGIPIDAHGYLAQIRQDIIKKNGLGFDGNTRYIPNSYAEYEQLLAGLREKADSGELWVRNISKKENHAWYQLKNGNSALDAASVVTKDNFYPSFLFEPESDLLTALYVNGGTLADANGNVNFQNCAGFVKFVERFVERYHSRLSGDVDGGKEAAFPVGKTVFFSEGPWQVANTYDFWWNNGELKQAGVAGVTSEDAADPIYTNPYAVSRSYWSSQPGNTSENADKWYGNGHVITLNKKMTSLKKIAGALVFAKWLTQEQNDNGGYILTEWCKAGHIPAWKNVYESEDYQNAKANSMTLTALGDPAEIICLESSQYASTLIAGLTQSYGIVHETLLSESGCTKEEVNPFIQSVAQSTQGILDILKL